MTKSWAFLLIFYKSGWQISSPGPRENEQSSGLWAVKESGPSFSKHSVYLSTIAVTIQTGKMRGHQLVDFKVRINKPYTYLPRAMGIHTYALPSPRAPSTSASGHRDRYTTLTKKLSKRFRAWPHHDNVAQSTLIHDCTEQQLIAHGQSISIRAHAPPHKPAASGSEQCIIPCKKDRNSSSNDVSFDFL